MLRKAVLVLLLLLLIFNLRECIPNAGAIDSELSYLFPSDGYEQERNRDLLADLILDGLDAEYTLNNVWKLENQSFYDPSEVNMYQYNYSANETLTMTYSLGYFISLEINSMWGVDSNPRDNVREVAALIGISDLDNFTVTSDQIPYYNPKGEIRGYYNKSALLGNYGYGNTNQIHFREVPKGEFVHSLVRIEAWYSGKHIFSDFKDEVIGDLREEVYPKESALEDREFISGHIVNIYDNRTILHIPTMEPSIHVYLYFTHQDGDSVYQVSSWVNANDGEIIEYELSVVANSTSYWPDDTDERRDDPEDGKIDVIVALFIFTGIILTFVLLTLLSTLVMVRKRSKDILDTIQRRRIFDLVQKDPGIHFRKIMRELEIKQGVLGFHLNKLEKKGYLRSIQKGQYRCFYASNAKSEIRMVLNEAQQTILHEIDVNPGISMTDLAEKLSRTRTLIYYHTTIMSDAGLIEKKKDGMVTSFFITVVGRDHISL